MSKVEAQAEKIKPVKQTQPQTSTTQPQIKINTPNLDAEKYLSNSQLRGQLESLRDNFRDNGDMKNFSTAEKILSSNDETQMRNFLSANIQPTQAENLTRVKTNVAPNIAGLLPAPKPTAQFEAENRIRQGQELLAQAKEQNISVTPALERGLQNGKEKAGR